MPIKTLPIGTVVQLTNYEAKIMICGRQQVDSEDGQFYDYSGCEYPGGFDGENIILFNAYQIAMLYHIGYQDLDEMHQKFVIAEIIKENE